MPVRRKAREIYLAALPAAQCTGGVPRARMLRLAPAPRSAGRCSRAESLQLRRAQGDTVCAPYSKGWRQRPWSSYTRSLGAQGVMAAKGLDDAAAEGGRQELPRQDSPVPQRYRLQGGVSTSASTVAPTQSISCRCIYASSGPRSCSTRVRASKLRLTGG